MSAAQAPVELIQLLEELIQLRGRDAAEDVLLGSLGRQRLTRAAANLSRVEDEVQIDDERAVEQASTYLDDKEDVSREQLD
eukprot:7129669-Prymnesium_polylepis.1